VFSALLKVAKYFRSTAGLCNLYKDDVVMLAKMDLPDLLAIRNKVFQICLFKAAPVGAIMESSGFRATSWQGDEEVPVLNESLVQRSDQKLIERPFQGLRVFTPKPNRDPEHLWKCSLNRIRRIATGPVRSIIDIIDKSNLTQYEGKSLSRYIRVYPARYPNASQDLEIPGPQDEVELNMRVFDPESAQRVSQQGWDPGIYTHGRTSSFSDDSDRLPSEFEGDW
jgi:hypothetical protein